MNKYTYTRNGFTFERVNKRVAQRCYNNGLTVVFCPCKICPSSFYGLDIDINKSNINCNYQPFETVLNAFEYYNCNSETGTYTSFFIPVVTVNGFKQYDYRFLGGNNNVH